MTQLVINVEDESILPSLKRILSAIEGISIIKPAKKKKSGLDEALDDVEKGRINHYESVEDLFKALDL